MYRNPKATTQSLVTVLSRHVPKDPTKTTLNPVYRTGCACVDARLTLRRLRMGTHTCLLSDENRTREQAQGSHNNLMEILVD